MKSDAKLMYRIADLTIHAMNGTLSEQDLKEFEELLASSPQAVRYYREILWTHVGLTTMEGISSLHEAENEEYDADLWQQLLENERTAPALHIPEDTPSPELIQKVIYPKNPHRISKFNLFSVIISAAAILFIVLFVNIAPDEGQRQEVATLTDAINVKWAAPGYSVETGDRLLAHQPPHILEKGLVKVRYDDGVEVVVEAPAKFEVQSKGMFLEYGRLYSRVPETGYGFTVDTPHSRFIDLGTEFGIKAGVDGGSELHVTKGKVQMCAGLPGKTVTSQTIRENTAARFDSDSGQLETIEIREDSFVRNISSQAGLIWKGEAVSLANIVSGGNGLGNVLEDEFIDTASGNFIPRNGKVGRLKGYNLYTPVASHYIDGVFVPDGENGPVITTSQGHRFEDCPDTDGAFANGIKPSLFSNKRQGFPQPVTALSMHPNQGITFDLNAIEADYGAVAAEFTAQCGSASLSPEGIEMIHNIRYIPDDYKPMVSFYVLVDGQLRYSREDVRAGQQFEPISVELKPEDRYLTLIATDGSDANSQLTNGYYLKPELKLRQP